MAKKKVARFGGDVREHPTYSIEEAALYLQIPKSTLASWVRGRTYPSKTGKRRSRPLIEAAEPKRNLLSFYNIAEAHVLAATHHRGIPKKNVRHAVDYVRQLMPGLKHPLISYDFTTYGKSLFVKHLGETFNATAQGQRPIMEVLEKFLEKIERASDGLPKQLTPFKSRVLVMNPNICSGRPVIKGRGIPAAVLLQRKEAGQTIDKVARDFGLEPREVEQAIEDFAA